MPLMRHKHSGRVREYPQNIIGHRVLGQNLEPYEPETEEYEEDKTVVEKKVVKTAQPKSPTQAPETDKDDDGRA